jgi:hypothetical protein
MEPTSTPAPPDRRAFAKIMKVALLVCLTLIVAGAITVVVAGDDSPLALAANIGGFGCMAGASVVLFRGMQKLALDPKYQLSAKGLALLLALAAAATLLFFWSISL